MISLLLGKNMSSIYRNLKHHQTLAFIYTQLWAHHINLYMQIGEVNHEASDVILNSFCSYYAFNVPGPCAMCYTCISQQLYEVGFIFCNWGSTVQVGNQAREILRFFFFHSFLPNNWFPSEGLQWLIWNPPPHLFPSQKEEDRAWKATCPLRA